MSTSYIWHIHELERTVADGVVFNVSFSIVATDGTYSASQLGSVALQAPAEGDTVIPYSDLTPSVVEGWVKGVIGAENVSTLETYVQGALDEQRAPTKAVGVPW